MSPKRKEKSKTSPGSPSLEDSTPQFLGKKRKPNITTKETKEKEKSYEKCKEEFHSNDSNDLHLKENSKNKSKDHTFIEKISSKEVFTSAEEIVKSVKKKLPKITSLTSLTEYYNSTCINLETQKQELSKIATVPLKGNSKINISLFNQKEDLVNYYKSRAKEIVAHVREDLSTVPSLRVTPRLLGSLIISSETEKTELSEIATVKTKKANFYIVPFSKDQKDSIIKALKTSKFYLNIKSEDGNIVATVREISDKLKNQYKDKIEIAGTYVKEEVKKLISVANYEIKELKTITGNDSIKQLENIIINTIKEEIKEAEKEIILKTEELNFKNTISCNKLFFDYDEDEFNEDYSFHMIIHSKADPNEKVINEGLKGQYLYSQNLDIPFEDAEKRIEFNYSISDSKKVMLSLNNNYGAGKSHYLEFIRYREKLKDYLILPRVELKNKPAPEALLEAILTSMSEGFDFKELAGLRTKEIEYKEQAIERICDMLIKIKRSILFKEEEKAKDYCRTLFHQYFIIDDYEDFDPELILKKIKDKRCIYFCLDEIGNTKIDNKKELYNLDYSLREIFEDLPDTHVSLIKIDEIRILLHKITNTLGLGAIVAGKNGINSFISDYDSSIQMIRNIYLSHLSKEHIESILKFELYRNSSRNLRKYLKQEYPKECNREKQNELNVKMDTLIDKLFEYTAGHPKLFKYTIDNLMVIDNLDSAEDDLMNKIKPKQLPDIFETFNNQILYLHFLRKLINPIQDSCLIQEIKGKELLYIFYLLNEGGNTDIKKQIVYSVFFSWKYDPKSSLKDLFESIGISYFEDTKKYTLKVIIPKYICELLKEIDLKSLPYDFAKQVILSKYKLMNERLGEFATIFTYVEDKFYKDEIKDYKLQLIDGCSKEENYLDSIFKQIGNLKPNKIVMFKKDNNYAIDGLMFKYCDNKLIIHLIHVKSDENIDKTKIFTQIKELEKGIKSMNSSLLEYLISISNVSLSKDDIQVTYILISKNELKDNRKKPKISFKWIKYEETDIKNLNYFDK